MTAPALPTSLARTRRRAALALALATVLSACAPPSRQMPLRAPEAAAATRAEPDAVAAYADYRQLEANGQAILRIDARRSLIAVTVRRGGTLARLGHDHVVASRTLAGFVAPLQNRADFHFRLDQMSVDEPVLRSEAGFAPHLLEAAIEGTRNNMLNKVLDAAAYPLVSVHARASGADDGVLDVAITLHGRTRLLRIPVRRETADDGSLSVSGTVNFRQSDFGLVPFSLFGGALAVEDGLELRFHIVAARRVADADAGILL